MEVKKILSGLLWLSLITTNSVSAITVKDMYNMQNKTFTAAYDSNVLETIRNYQDAKRYAAMFKYVLNSEYDTSILDYRIENEIKDVSNIENKLLHAYDLPLSEIYDLEDKYVTAVTTLSNNVSAAELGDFNFDVPTNVPSVYQYKNALKQKALVDANTTIATAPIHLFSAKVTPYEVTDTTVTYAVRVGTVIVAPFSGTISAIHTDSITVDCGYDILYSIKGINSGLEVGDYVDQEHELGLSTDLVSIRVKVDNEFIDISKLMEDIE